MPAAAADALNPVAAAWLAEAQRRLRPTRQLLETADAVARCIPASGLGELPAPVLLAACGSASPEDAIYSVNEMVRLGLLTLLWSPRTPARTAFYVYRPD